MSRQRLLVAAGCAAFLVFLAILVPAPLLLRWLPAGITANGLEGTIWSGRAQSVGVGGRTIGAVAWSCRPWRLVVLEWSCRLELQPPDGELSVALSGGFDGPLQGRDLAGSLAIEQFQGIGVPTGWTGHLELDVARLVIAGGLPVEAEGRLFVRELKAPGPDGAKLGDFELIIGEGAVGTGALTGRLRDLGGPLRVRGTVELKEGRSYLLTGEVAPGPGAGEDIFDTLAFLGPPDSLGRRPFTVEGTL
ncbi:MAG TPA: type II secretion system protein N [Steroidobacteraceae bacterium]|nr:type II secretion system protein N [Steroidobacteraceae bacterium]